MAAKLHPPWEPSVISAVCNVLASTDWPGLSNSEIDRLMALVGIPDAGGPNKRTRLWASLVNRQHHDGAANCVIRFIREAMRPGLFLNDHHRFEALREGLAEAMVLVGLCVTESGEIARTAATARTLDEVAVLAGRLRSELSRRGVHPEVLRYCEEELLRRSLFHAVFEAVKGVAERLRQLALVNLDGAELVDHCFGARAGAPVVQINGYITESDRSEHRGFANLLKGIFGTFRNPPAHTPRATTGWSITEPDALDLFSMLSLVHRRLDQVKAPATP
jgi:uncharacterized protein (TIGR02391 family)